MKDRIVEYPNRYRLVPAGEDFVDLIPAPGYVTQEGTPLNKAALLTDETAEQIWPYQETRPNDPTVNDALGKLQHLIHLAGTHGHVEITESGMFDPAQYGLEAGMKLDITCVGGGAGGDYSYQSGSGGDAGKGGNPGSGGGTSTSKGYGGGGGGAGGGYGAGGGGAGGNAGVFDTFSNDVPPRPGGNGGGAGKVVKATVTLQSIDPIAVTIGAGGLGGISGTRSATAGGTTSFGPYVSASGGEVSGGGTGGTSRGNIMSNGYRSGGGAGGGGAGGYIPDNPAAQTDGCAGGIGGGSGNPVGGDGDSSVGTGGGGGAGGGANSQASGQPGTSAWGGDGGSASTKGSDGGIGSGLVVIEW